MDCDHAKMTYSASLDGEATALERRSVDAHLESCSDCREFAAAADRVQRMNRVRPAEHVPDLSQVIMSAAHPPRLGRGEWIRYSLATVALTELVLALPALVLAEEPGTTAHLARHIGALTAAMALGFLYTAWRPQRAYGVLPIASALSATMALSALFDIAGGVTPLISEAHHVVELAGFLLVWMLAGTPGLSRLYRVRSLRRAAMFEADVLDEVA